MPTDTATDIRGYRGLEAPCRTKIHRGTNEGLDARDEVPTDFDVVDRCKRLKILVGQVDCFGAAVLLLQNGDTDAKRIVERRQSHAHVTARGATDRLGCIMHGRDQSVHKIFQFVPDVLFTCRYSREQIYLLMKDPRIDKKRTIGPISRPNIPMKKIVLSSHSSLNFDAIFDIPFS